MNASTPRALFAISSLGLGHATRSLAVILDYLERGWAITIVSNGNALELLRRELSESPRVDFREMADYPPLERGTGWRFYWYLLRDLLDTRKLIRYERRQLRQMESGYDFVFSDGRYGFYSRTIPSFILTHQVAFMPPRFLKSLSRLTERINLLALRRFDLILIPDYPDKTTNLSGRLSHTKYLAGCNHRYIGILSSYRKQELTRDIDYLFVISGYLLEHKKAFLSSLVSQAAGLPGKKVFVLGQKDCSNVAVDASAGRDIEIVAMADGWQRQNLFNRAATVIGRAGYTTVMDLVEHDKRALLIPTPNQTEQEYLARYLGSRNHFAWSTQSAALDLRDALRECEATEPFDPPWRTRDSLQKIRGCIEPFLRTQFISLVVPAHNEEAELAECLRCLLAQNYPAQCYEIIVVENGSSDNTLRLARQIAQSAAGNRHIQVLQSGRGVSVAKNAGIAHTAPASEWVVLCDADTHLGPLFLRQLNRKILRSDSAVCIGTCSIRPHETAHAYARGWFSLYNFIHRWTRTSYSLQIARTAIARRIGFHHDLQVAEDLMFFKDCLQCGTFFFLQTDQVSTSTRRFEAFGYLRLSLRWAFQALLPRRVKRTLSYHVIRRT